MGEAAVVRVGHDEKTVNHRLAVAARDWEVEIGGFKDMSGIISTLADKHFTDNKVDEDTYHFTKDDVDQFLFAIFHLEGMIKSFVGTYYTAIEAN